MKIHFVIPRYDNLTFPHLGVAYLMANLEKNNIDSAVTDMSVGNDIEDVCSQIEEYQPDIVGISSPSLGYERAYAIIEHFREIIDKPVIIGGPHVSAIKKRILEDTKADFAVKGEGEHTLVYLLQAIDAGENDFSKIEGLIWRNNGTVIENEDRPFNKQLDDLPWPAFYKFELDRYPLCREKTLPLITSRGCPFNCIFCSVKLSMGRNFRPRSADRVVEEISYWHEKGWQIFDIQDDCFSFDMKRAKSICRMIIDKNIKINWVIGNGIRADCVDKELLMLMKESGCQLVSFGVETGSPEINKFIKKGVKLEKIEEAVKLAAQVGLNRVGTFIVGHPTETFDEFEKSLSFAKRMPFNFANFYNIVPYPGTELSQWVNNNAKLLYDERTYLNKFSYGHNNPIYETNEFSVKERKKALSMGQSYSRRLYYRFKLGKILGDMGWVLAFIPGTEVFLRRLFKKNPIGRSIFKHIKKN